MCLKFPFGGPIGYASPPPGVRSTLARQIGEPANRQRLFVVYK
jgi:hypothetical protein